MSQVFLFIGGSEIVVILLIVVMLFGANKIPEIARGLAKGLQEVKNASNEIKREINSQSGGMADVAREIKQTADTGRRKMTDFKGAVQEEIKKTVDAEPTKETPAPKATQLEEDPYNPQPVARGSVSADEPKAE